MSAPAELLLLRQDLSKATGLLEEVDAFLRSVQAHELVALGRTRSSALIVAQILENFYTCAETFFLRVAQCFENHLQADKWHADLLDRMTQRVEGVREALLSAESYTPLRELMRFRHFKRYYFELDYDWEKLDFLLHQYAKARPALASDLARFDDWLKHLTAVAP